MNGWYDQLLADLDLITRNDLCRRLRVYNTTGPRLRCGSRTWVNLSSNDYLGLSQHPKIKQAAIDSIQIHGTGSGASRLISGNLSIHQSTEEKFARFKHAESALITPTGYMANLTVLGALARPGDLICLDKLSHASLIDAARTSGATVRVYPHKQTDKLTRLLHRHANAQTPSNDHSGRVPRRFIVTDTVFSMDGDTADLPRICEVADDHDAILIADEAHATGVLGEQGAGLCELQGVQSRVDVVISTASKALGSLGGIITARREVIDTLVNRARPFIYTTAVPPAMAAMIGAALDLIRDEPWRRHRLGELSLTLDARVREIGWGDRLPEHHTPETPIFSLIVGDAALAVGLSEHLLENGVYAPAIRPPSVPPGTARVRVSLRADLDDRDLDPLIHALATWADR